MMRETDRVWLALAGSCRCSLPVASPFRPECHQAVTKFVVKTLQPFVTADVIGWVRLRSFGVEGPLLKTFYDSVVASAIFYGVVCWGGSISAGDRKRLNRLIRRASSVLGCPLNPVEVVSDRRMVAKLSSLLDNISHPMQETLTTLSSSFSGRLQHPQCGTERFRRSFLPTADRLHNKDFCS